MAGIRCADCFNKYMPYTFSKTFRRFEISGVDEWQGLDYEEAMISRLINDGHLFDLDTISKSHSLESAEDLMVCRQHFDNEIRRRISASFICLDCEKYLCSSCINKHSNHSTFEKGDSALKIVESAKKETSRTLETKRRNNILLCDSVDVNTIMSPNTWEEVIASDDKASRLRTLDIGCIVTGITFSQDNTEWLAADYGKKCIKVFCLKNNRMIRYIKLSSKPFGIANIPTTTPYQSLFAVSFPGERLINILDLQSKPTAVVSSIDVDSACYDIVYCKNRFITTTVTLDKQYTIQVLEVSGAVTKVIGHNYQRLAGYNFERFSVHLESESIYACHMDPSCVFRLSLDGRVLGSTMTPVTPRNICIDRYQNIYVIGKALPMYRISADLSQKEIVIDKNDEIFASKIDERSDNIASIACHNDKIYLALKDGYIYIFRHE